MAALPDGLRAALADRYRIDRELGRGGMATVYLAHDLKHDRPVALKAAASRARRRPRDLNASSGRSEPRLASSTPTFISRSGLGRSRRACFGTRCRTYEGESLARPTAAARCNCRSRMRSRTSARAGGARARLRPPSMGLSTGIIKPENILLSDGPGSGGGLSAWRKGLEA